MRPLSRRLSRKKKNSHPNLSSDCLHEHAPDPPTQPLQDPDSVGLPQTPNCQNPPEPSVTSTPNTARKPLLLTPNSTQARGAGLIKSSSRLSGLYSPLGETSIFPSDDKSSRLSSTTIFSSEHQLPPTRFSKARRVSPQPSIRPPPWDRSIELVWARSTSPPQEAADGEYCKASFQENLRRLKHHHAITNRGGSREARPDEQLKEDTTSSSHMAASEVSLRSSEQGLAHSSKPPNSNCRYFLFPDHIRFKIMKHLLESHNPSNKPIRMNNPVYLWEVWPANRLRKPKVWLEDYFDSLETALSSVERYTSTCTDMRADMLATLFLTRRFHVVYAPCMGRMTQLAATYHMNKYGPLMAFINLEIDLTKLAGSWTPEAANLDAPKGLDGVRELVAAFVQSQLTRSSATSIRDLRVLVRRYYGVRPAAPSTPPTPISSINHPVPAQTKSENSPNGPSEYAGAYMYTPTAHIRHALSPLKSLGPVVRTLTITGATVDFAAELAAALSPDETPSASPSSCRVSVHYRAPATGYPVLLPGQRAVVTCGDSAAEKKSTVGMVTEVEGDENDVMSWGKARNDAGYRVLSLADRPGIKRRARSGNGEGNGALGKREKKLKPRGRVGGGTGLRSRASDGLGVLASRLRGKEPGEEVGVLEPGDDTGGDVKVKRDQKEVREARWVKRGDKKDVLSGKRVVQCLVDRVASGGPKGLFGHY